ncbi:MAG: hypothetical protein ACI977_000724 [Candidatus Nanohaloarchaea archaeon]|jgi:hypothetical protein
MTINGIDQVGEGTYQTELTEDDLYEFDQGDHITDEYVQGAVGDDGVYIAAVENGPVYQMPGNFNEWDVAQALGEDTGDVTAKFVTYDEDAKTSTSASRVNEKQAQEVTADAAVAILNGRIQKKHGESTSAVEESEPIDVIR